jgi:putative ABC transport system substrate-binding protein
LAAVDFAQAQQPQKVPRIGYLASADPARESTRAEGIRLALRERGHIEGQNIAIEYRYAEGKVDRFSELAAELVRLKIDIIVVAGGNRLILAAKNATKTIPIVMTGGVPILSRRALLKALPVPAAMSPALQTLAEN